jgi:hypothetical protein
MLRIGSLHAADVSFLRNPASASMMVYKVQVSVLCCKLIMLQSEMQVYIVTATRCHSIPDKHNFDCAALTSLRSTEILRTIL